MCRLANFATSHKVCREQPKAFTGDSPNSEVSWWSKRVTWPATPAVDPDPLGEKCLAYGASRLMDEHNRGQGFPWDRRKRRSVHCRRKHAMQPVKSESSKTAEIQKLRRELLRRIVENENRRQADRRAASK